MILRRLKLITGTGITYGAKLNTVAKELLNKKFAGVFLATDMPIKLDNNTGVLINKPINVHWIAQAKINNKIYTYDSYGRNMGPNAVKDTPIDFIQKGKQMDCGSRSLTWLYNKLA